MKTTKNAIWSFKSQDGELSGRVTEISRDKFLQVAYETDSVYGSSSMEAEASTSDKFYETENSGTFDDLETAIIFEMEYILDNLKPSKERTALKKQYQLRRKADAAKA